ncbi:MAG: phospho-sugar mutase [Pirellulaceae bacterium]|nr:phospho-sugar mutase [Pirellulaceae bacterium]
MNQAEQQAALDDLERAATAGRLSPGAVDNIRIWLTEARYRRFAPQVVEHLRQGMWRELDDAFWTVIPFGTGGRRGRMYPIGSNAINERTIGESAQGLAEYVLEQQQAGRLEVTGELACGIAYDTRHMSREFAELCAAIMVAHGFRVYFLDEHRSTPELSFLVRYKQCACGIMVTASHNPPSDNAVKVYWSSGGQVLPPHDRGIIDRVMRVGELREASFADAVEDGRVIRCREEVDRAYQAAVLAQAIPGPRDLKIIYSPLHGVGSASVCPLLAADGFGDVEVYPRHAEPDGDFPNVPEHVSNPENPHVFSEIIQRARQTGAELILATDPDCDRMGCAAPLTLDPEGPWSTLTGNQIGALLADFVLEHPGGRGRWSNEHYVVQTLVTSRMIERIATSYRVRTIRDLQVGFKWIGGVMDERGPDRFVFGAEESHGYLTGQYVRDKDGGLACLLMAELAARVKAQGKSLHEKLAALYWQHGYHAERLLNLPLPGSEGMQAMDALMARFRRQPPRTLGGIDVAEVLDYQALTRCRLDGASEPMPGAPPGNMVILELAEEGNYVAVRPSGTEPKVKFYMFTFTPAELLADLELSRQELDARLDGFERDLKQFAGIEV